MFVANLCAFNPYAPTRLRVKYGLSTQSGYVAAMTAARVATFSAAVFRCAPASAILRLVSAVSCFVTLQQPGRPAIGDEPIRASVVPAALTDDVAMMPVAVGNNVGRRSQARLDECVA